MKMVYWDANVNLLNEGVHNVDDMSYYTEGIDVNNDLSEKGYGSNITQQLYNSSDYGNENRI